MSQGLLLNPPQSGQDDRCSITASEQGLLMPQPRNERITENVVRDEFRRLGYYKAANKIVVEEQKSNIEAVKKLMRAASKSGHGGIGSPEFIISSAISPDFLVIVECKADPRDHVSDTCKRWLSRGGGGN